MVGRTAITLKLEASCGGGEGLLFSREKKLSSLGIWHRAARSLRGPFANDDDCCRFTTPERDRGTEGMLFQMRLFLPRSLALHIRCSCRFGFPSSAVGAIKELGDGLLCVTSEGGRRRNGEMVRTMRWPNIVYPILQPSDPCSRIYLANKGTDRHASAAVAGRMSANIYSSTSKVYRKRPLPIKGANSHNPSHE